MSPALILSETADRLRGALRAGDTLSRWGGDEFVALLPASMPDEAITAIERLREGTPERASFSAGLAAWDGDESLDELMRRADVALYAAKTSGGNRVELGPQALGSTAEGA